MADCGEGYGGTRRLCAVPLAERRFWAYLLNILTGFDALGEANTTRWVCMLWMLCCCPVSGERSMHQIANAHCVVPLVPLVVGTRRRKIASATRLNKLRRTGYERQAVDGRRDADRYKT